MRFLNQLTIKKVNKYRNKKVHGGKSSAKKYKRPAI